MDKKRIEELKHTLSTKVTDELIDIWVENDRTQYCDEAFAAIDAILRERGVERPKQREYVAPEADNSSGSTEPVSEGVQQPKGPRIRPPVGERILGVVGTIFALPLGLRGFIMLVAAANAPDSAHTGYAFGAAIALLAVAGGILKWSFSQFRAVPVDEYLRRLDEPDFGKRHTAATVLYRAQWEPDNESQKLKILVEAQKYDEALAFGEEAIERMVAKLKDKSEITAGPSILNTFENAPSKHTIACLIELLDVKKLSVSKRSVVITLKRMTGEDLGKDKHAWAKWFNENQERI